MAILLPRIVVPKASDVEALGSLTEGELAYDDTENRWKGYNGTAWKVVGGDQDAWTSVTFTGTWVNFGGSQDTVQYMKDEMGFVHLKGSAKSGTAGTSIFTLPVGYRPATNCNKEFITSRFGGVATVTIVPAGTVTPDSAAGNALVELEGITFKV